MRSGAVLAIALLAGCMQAESMQSAGTPTVPKWSIGDRWSYLDGAGNWENWTVISQEPQEGRSAYRVQAEFWPPDQFGVTSADAWIDAENLGVLRSLEQDGFGVRANPAVNQLFPMTNHSYNSTLYTPTGTRNFQATLIVQGWESVETPAGIFDSLRVRLRDEALDEEFTIWYSPTVGNFVKRESDTTQLLAAWEQT